MSTTGPSARLGLDAPNGDEPIKNGDDTFRDWRTKLDSNAAMFVQGTHAARPAAGMQGRFYYETDTVELFYDNGTAWSFVPIGTMPQARVFSGSDTTALTATETVLPFASEAYDLGTATEQHSTSVNTSRLTCRVAGLYRIGAWVSFHANATGMRRVSIMINGVLLARDQVPAVSATDEIGLVVSTEQRLNVGDFAEVSMWQNSGGNLDNLSLRSAFWWSYASP